jgi:RNA recognition motif-containing protein
MPLEQRTTVTLSNLPNDYTSVLLIETLADEGFQNTYDFVYLPMDLRTQTSNGYALVNFRLHEDASRVLAHFNGFKAWRVSSSMSCLPSWSQFIQGLPALIDRYRNSPIMHNAVPRIYKPSLFDTSGKPVQFPEPTKRIRMPRLRRKSKETYNDYDGDSSVEAMSVQTMDSFRLQKNDVSQSSSERDRTKTVHDDPSEGDDIRFQAMSQNTVKGYADSTQQQAQSTQSTPRCEPFTSTPSLGQWVHLDDESRRT